jgi:spore maturation protein CgeB
MYAALSSAKLLLNPATDIAGDIRGNMRCWEALGCGACMLGSAGQYPEGFEPGVNFEVFTDVDDLRHKVKLLLADEFRRAEIGKAGADMLSHTWSKERQWDDFLSLLALL